MIEPGQYSPLFKSVNEFDYVDFNYKKWNWTVNLFHLSIIIN